MAWSGASGSNRGAGMRSRMAWNRGSRSVPTTPCSVAAHPALALEKRMGKSIWCSSASRSKKSSSTSLTTSSMRASGAVDLVDHQDDRQPGPEGLAQHEPGLGQGALGGVDEQEHTVHHGEAPFHLAAEVGMAGRVDDVDLHAVVHDGRVLGQDGDALFALEVAGVHDPFVDRLVGAEGAGLPEHGVDQGRLPMVDVSHDGYVANVVTGLHEGVAGPFGGTERVAVARGVSPCHCFRTGDPPTQRTAYPASHRAGHGPVLDRYRFSRTWAVPMSAGPRSSGSSPG